MSGSGTAGRAGAVLDHVRRRIRTGLGRVRAGFGQSLQITIAAVGAYAFAEHVLGHHGPLFSATAAIVSLGYGNGSVHLRRILEVSLGCTLGIAVGDVLMHVLGQGLVQASVVLLVSILLARFLDNGTIFTTQMGLQSVLVVILPPSVDGPFARSLDAIVGACFALAIMAISPRDPSREARRGFRTLSGEFSAVLREIAAALGGYDAERAQRALRRGRRTQPSITALESALKMGREQARFTLLRRGRLEEIEAYERCLDALDHAVRNTRVLARRLTAVIRTVRLRPQAVAALEEILTELAEAVDLIGASFAGGSTTAREAFSARARADLTRVAQRLDPAVLGVRTYQGESLVMLIRPLSVDLLAATGLPYAKASTIPVQIRQELTEALPVVDPEEDDRPGTRTRRESD